MAGNPLLNLLGMSQTALPGNTQSMIQRFMQFKNMFHGDPRQQIQQMLNTGQISQEQYARAVQMANELQKLLR